MDADEVTHLATVFEDDGSVAIHQARSEDRSHARIWVRERLARAVDIEITERDHRYSIGAPEQQGHPFLIFFRKRVNRGALQRLAFIRRNRSQAAAAVRAQRVPLFVLQLVSGTRAGRYLSTWIAPVLPFPIN